MNCMRLYLLMALILMYSPCRAADPATPVAAAAPIVMPLRADASGVVWLPTVGLGLIRRPESSAFAGVIVYAADNDMTRAYERMGADIDPALRIDPGLGAVGLRLGETLNMSKLPEFLRMPDDAPAGATWLVRKNGGLVTFTLRDNRVESITVYGPFILNSRLVEEHAPCEHGAEGGHGHDHSDGSSCCELSKLTPAPPQTDALPVRALILNPDDTKQAAHEHAHESQSESSVIRWPLIALLGGLLLGGIAGYRQARNG